MKKFLSVLSFAALVSAAGAAQAQWYASGAGSYVVIPDVDVNNLTQNVAAVAEISDGWGFHSALGYAFPNNLRAELEVGYTRNRPKKTTVPSVPITLVTRGRSEAWTALANVYYDFRNSTRFTPYVGGGAGVSRNRNVSIIPAISSSEVADTVDTVFIYQGTAGVSYDIAPRTAVFTAYRYTAGQDVSGRSHGGDVSESEVHSHQAMMGVRINF